MKKNTILGLLCTCLLLWTSCQLGDSEKEKTTEKVPTKNPIEKGNAIQTMKVVEAPVNLEQLFYKRLEGFTENNEPLTVHLIRKGEQLAGNYFFQTTGHTVLLSERSRIEASNKVVLQGDFESNNVINPTQQLQRINGTFVNNQAIKGTCAKPSQTSQQVVLQENYPTGSTSLEIAQFNKQGGKDCDNSLCINFDLIYPIIAADKASNRIRNPFNDSIRTDVINFVKAWVPEDKLSNTLTIEEAANYAINDILKMVEEEGERFFATGKWAIEVEPKVWTNDSHILSTSLHSYSYMGGAHPNTYNKFINYDIKNGKTLQLDDIFVNYQSKLRQLVMDDLKKQSEAPLSKDLKDIGFFVSDKEFKLSNNYYITPDGIHFYYNTYEIASYVQGDFYVSVPFTAINNLIKQDGPLMGYAKF